MKTKYDIELNIAPLLSRMTNQLWKLIPMREKEEDWKKQLETCILELVGLNEIFGLDPSFLELLSKLEGLLKLETDFRLYRKTVFESITLLRSFRYE